VVDNYYCRGRDFRYNAFRAAVGQPEKSGGNAVEQRGIGGFLPPARFLYQIILNFLLQRIYCRGQ